MTTMVAERGTAGGAPERSLAQRREALERANDVRARRSALKRDLKGGRVSVVAVLTGPPACAESMKVRDLLMAVPKFGRVKVNKVLGRCAISPVKTVGGLSPRQRDVIVGLLRSRC